MPRLKNAVANTATRIVGVTATTLNSITRRTCSREPAEPRRRSTQTRVSRPASTAPSTSSTTRLASAMANRGSAPCRRTAAGQDHERRDAEHQRDARQRQRDHLAQQRVRHAPRRSARRRRCGGASERSRVDPQPMPRTTGMSRSRIFLRSVLRFRPSIAAALIWLPRVAAASSGSAAAPPRRSPGRRCRASACRPGCAARNCRMWRSTAGPAAPARRPRRRQLGAAPARLASSAAITLAGDDLLRVQRRQPAHQVLQLAHVAGPAVRAQRSTAPWSSVLAAGRRRAPCPGSGGPARGCPPAARAAAAGGSAPR